MNPHQSQHGVTEVDAHVVVHVCHETEGWRSDGDESVALRFEPPVIARHLMATRTESGFRSNKMIVLSAAAAAAAGAAAAALKPAHGSTRAVAGQRWKAPAGTAPS